MLRPGIKRLAIFVMLLYIFVIKSGYTSADIFADRIVRNNRFSATSVDFSTRSSFNDSTVISLFHSLGIQPGGFDIGAVKVRAETDTKFKYRLKVIKTNGDDYFCNRLQVGVFNRNLTNITGGSLTNLFLTSSFANMAAKDYIFFVSLDEDSPSLKNKICEFSLDFRTYKNSPDEKGGIFAERIINNVVSSGEWK